MGRRHHLGSITREPWGLQYTVILDKSGATVYGALYGGPGGGVYLVGSFLMESLQMN